MDYEIDADAAEDEHYPVAAETPFHVYSKLEKSGKLRLVSQKLENPEQISKSAGFWTTRHYLAGTLTRAAARTTRAIL